MSTDDRPAQNPDGPQGSQIKGARYWSRVCTNCEALFIRQVGRPIPKMPFCSLECRNAHGGGRVRPDHLFLGTAKDNSMDMSRKGRGRKAAHV